MIVQVQSSIEGIPGAKTFSALFESLVRPLGKSMQKQKASAKS
jgi:hypothetical protein